MAMETGNMTLALRPHQPCPLSCAVMQPSVIEGPDRGLTDTPDLCTALGALSTNAR